MKQQISIPTRLLLISTVLGVFAMGSAQAQLYKWVGADGKVTYSDVPPPPSVKQVQTRSLDSGEPASNLPPELGAAAAKNPVTLYTGPDCSPCNEGRAFLKGSGIPFKEKTVKSDDDVKKLKEVSGDTQLPVLVINSSKFRGLDTSEWRTALSSAGYPETDKLPKDFKYSAAEAAAPTPAAKPKDAANNGNSSKARQKNLPPANTNNEGGFRF
ncbi:glutaredoxin family protein [Undibacterium sp. RTI2.1]|nr:MULTISPECIES: glutaredoxin family protein [unclassified Undibacterium]MEB0032865.1 glutaredoxin family protein [Undibacterium sp. RTI2.1]MEB0116724.1 glutaredoxin family protein [Undibacterium sp. RTI2.2]MDY7538124.1 glutaredoxin family protein [Undibacterium sp. 5I1]MEB0232884.1 glutaredoxin family protein [Undibacterium sp. 10I3]MEB0257394.1 glutaredoxin family protein [Undibacterium sp. 5I1]